MPSQALCVALLQAATAFVSPRFALRRTPPQRSTTAAYERERTPVFNFDAAPEATAALWERIDDAGHGRRLVVEDRRRRRRRGVARHRAHGRRRLLRHAHGGPRRAARPVDSGRRLRRRHPDLGTPTSRDGPGNLRPRTAASRSEIVYSASGRRAASTASAGRRSFPSRTLSSYRARASSRGAAAERDTVRFGVRFGFTLSRFGAASINMTEVKLRDGPFAVKLNAAGVYGAEKVDVPTIGRNVVESKPNSAGRPSMKQNGLILGLALTDPAPDGLPGVLGRRTKKAPGAADAHQARL